MFPFPRLWPNSEENVIDPVSRIDRHLADRSQRLSAGLSVASDYRRIHGALLVTHGRGKFLRVNHVFHCETELPTDLQRAILENVSSAKSAVDLAQLKFDLADYQNAAAHQLKILAGKYVDRLTTLAIDDPGVWTQDFDGQKFYSSLCDATRLAEISGLNVIDGFPARDLAAGGNAEGISALPLWILFADRHPRIAKHNTAVLRFGATSELFLLPASDGLDAELPNIQLKQLPGFHFIAKLATSCGFPLQDNDLDLNGLYVDGQVLQDLKEIWQTSFEGGDSDSWVEQTQSYMKTQKATLSSLIRTAISFVMDEIKQNLKHANRLATNERPFDRIWVAADETMHAVLINQFEQAFDYADVQSVSKLNLSQPNLDAVLASLLGLMHVDQMGGNIPWITGANSLRCLGQLTPGRPASWRQLVMEMADFQPLAMKLKDAV